jgi:hypothetical protein
VGRNEDANRFQSSTGAVQHLGEKRDCRAEDPANTRRNPPEAVYFSERGGKRGGIMIVDVADPSKVPSIAEPLFLTFNASVEFHIAMGPQDLGRAGLDELGKKYA